MVRLSVKISDYLYQQILEKGRQMGIDNVSETVRILLLWVLENQAGSNSALLYRATSYAVMVHCLIEQCMLSWAEGGPELIDKAHVKANRLLSDLPEKP